MLTSCVELPLSHSQPTDIVFSNRLLGGCPSLFSEKVVQPLEVGTIRGIKRSTWLIVLFVLKRFSQAGILLM